METNQKCFIARASVVAVRGALIAMAAMPVAYAADNSADVTAADLTQQSSTVEVGVTNTNENSAKFGEFNGLEKKGAHANVGIDVRGGGSYDSDNATRFRIKGTDLGLENRSLNAEYGQQGKFRLNFGYDELLRNRSDSYQTPLQGVGTNHLTMPSNWIVPQLPVQISSSNITNTLGLDPGFANRPKIGSVTVGGSGATAVNGIQQTYPTAANLAVSSAIIGADIPDFKNVDLHTKRSKSEVGFGLNIDRQWQVTGSMSHEKKEGLKPLSTVIAGNNAGTIAGGTGRSGDVAMVIPDLIDQHHDQFNLGIGYKGEQGFVQVAYYGSRFVNDVTDMSWQDWAFSGAKNTTAGSPLLNTYPTGYSNPLALPNVMSSAPTNRFNQLNVTGGYDITKTTKLVLNGSYGRNTQNEQFLTSATPGVIEYGYTPASSLEGLVVSKAFNAKLTAKPDKAWNLAANYKYDDRDNRTPVNIYGYGDVGENFSGTPTASSLWSAAMMGWPAGTVVPSVTNVNANRPYSKKLNQLNLDADYAFTATQKLKLGYDWQKIDRTCEGSWIQCADAATTKENTVRAEWRGKLTDDLTGKLGYAYSQRKVDNYDENAFLALTPMANQVSTAANTYFTGLGITPVSAYGAMQMFGLTGFGMNAGYPTPAQLAALTPAQLAVLQYYFGAAPASSLNTAGTVRTNAAGTAGANGTGVLGNTLYGNRNRISELIGMRRFNMADRNRDKLRANLDWQANEKFSFQSGMDYSNDKYANSVYGLQKAEAWSLNLDGNYAASEDFSFGFFYTLENQRSRTAGNNLGTNSDGLLGSTTTVPGGVTTVTPGNAAVGQVNATGLAGSSSCNSYTTVAQRNQNAKTDPCLNWTADMRDRANTLGASFKVKNMLAGKLELTGDVTFTRADSDVGFSHGGTYANNPYAVALGSASQVAVPAGFVGAIYIPATDMPTVTTNTIALKLVGKYALDKVSTVRVGYGYSRMTTVDYQYDALQVGGTPTSILPTNEQAPAYSVHMISASYAYTFR